MPQRDLQRRAQRAAWWSRAAASRLPLLRFLTRGPLLSGRSPQSPFAPPVGPDGAPSGVLRSGPYPPRFVPPLTLTSRVAAPAAPDVEPPEARTTVSGRMAAIAAAEASPGSSAYATAPGREHDPQGGAPGGGRVPQDGAPGGGDESARVNTEQPEEAPDRPLRALPADVVSGVPPAPAALAELRPTAPAAALPATPQSAAPPAVDPLPVAAQAVAPVGAAPLPVALQAGSPAASGTAVDGPGCPAGRPRPPVALRHTARSSTGRHPARQSA